MGLIKLSGAGSQISYAKENENFNQVVDVATKYDASTLIADEITQRSYLNEDYDVESVSDVVLDALAVTVQGASVFVTYFNYIRSNVDQRSNQADNVIEYDTVHYAYSKILHFEMKVQGSFNFDFAQDPSITSWTGTAYTFPYFKPNIGDYFIYSVDNNTTGLFKVTGIKRLGIRAQTWTEITFELVKYPATAEETAAIDESVANTYYFNTEAFLASNGALLTTAAAEVINLLTAYRLDLADYYFTKFFDKYYHHTFLRPDGAYDPYVVEFWYKLKDPCKNNKVPTKLIPSPFGLTRSIWWDILYPDRKIKDAPLTKYRLDIWNYRVWDTAITSLINKDYVNLYESTETTALDYPLWDYTTRTDRFGTLLNLYLTAQTVNTDNLIADILATSSKDDTAIFYETPVLLHLCDRVIRKLKYT